MGHRVADAHVDVLWQMLKNNDAFLGDSRLQASARKLLAGGVETQVFALFVFPSASPLMQMESVLKSIDMFYESVVHRKPFRPVRNRSELQRVRANGDVACLLSVEGAGCIRGQSELLRVLFRLGVRGMGLTWNGANELADGCREPRGGGLTQAGMDVVKEMDRLGMWIDVAHLGDTGVHDVFRMSDGPVMASHANCRSIHDHPRNLTDDVIREIVRRQGWMGLVFEGSFVGESQHASIEGVFRHLDHLLDLGAEHCIGFGSDFDGLTNTVPQLADAGDYARFSRLVVERYGEALGEKILFGNFERFLLHVLPS